MKKHIFGLNTGSYFDVETSINLKDESIIIADVHYDINHRSKDFEEFISKLEKNPPPQLILLGDIFELLFGGIQYTEKQNSKMINKLNHLGKKIEIIYFEGNHDFNLKNIFPYIKIVPISQQPTKMRYKKQTILISHGDYSVKGFYHLYRRMIEKNYILKTLNFIDNLIGNKIIRNLKRKQVKKRKCYKIEKFKDLIKIKLKDINIDLFIEGHYHQGDSFIINKISYLNIFSFACNQTYFIVKSKQNTVFLKSINLKDF